MALLLTWKPETTHESPTNMDWAGMGRIIQAVRSHGEWTADWRSTTRTRLGENIFLLKQGGDPRGIFGWGQVVGPWFRDPSGTARTRVLITEILDPREELILGYADLQETLKLSDLNTPGSGRRISDEEEAALNVLWIERNNALRTRNAGYSGRNVRANSLVRIGQASFAAQVKLNYGGRCAVCSIAIPEFLVTAHIVRWADDESIRLDPKNAICLCSLHDKAFEHGFFFLDENLKVTFSAKLESDLKLQKYLGLKPGLEINLPISHPPHLEYLVRHRNGHEREHVI